MTRRDATLLIAVNSLLSLAMVGGVSAWLLRAQKPTFGTLDVAELYRLKESQVAAMLVKRDTSDTERAMAIQRVAAFGGEVSKLIESLPEECGCLVLTRGAVLGSGAQLIDLTPGLYQRRMLYWHRFAPESRMMRKVTDALLEHGHQVLRQD